MNQETQHYLNLLKSAEAIDLSRLSNEQHYNALNLRLKCASIAQTYIDSFNEPEAQIALVELQINIDNTREEVKELLQEVLD